jgi:glycosyltransferase involved in cell wall biosynthesis
MPVKQKKIAILSSNICALPPFSPPPGFSCAPEWIITSIAEGLAKKDWDVSVYASGDSKLSIPVISAFDQSFDATVGWDLTNTSQSVSKLLNQDNLLTSKCIFDANQGKYDIILSNLDLKSAPFAKLSSVPFVSILHSPLQPDGFIKYYANDQYWISISNNQRIPIPELNYLATIYNGIDTDLFKPKNNSAEYLLSLGRIDPTKGTHIAIEVAKQTNKKLLICGSMTDRIDYFNKMILPHIDNQNIIHIPFIDKSKVPEIISKAEAMLFPLQLEEPFGLVITEAMGCGVPVICFDRGAVRELIIDGETGFIVDNQEKMVEAIGNLNSIDRNKCREHVVKNFSIQKMIDEYDYYLSSLI